MLRMTVQESRCEESPELVAIADLLSVGPTPGHSFRIGSEEGTVVKAVYAARYNENSILNERDNYDELQPANTRTST